MKRGELLLLHGLFVLFLLCNSFTVVDRKASYYIPINPFILQIVVFFFVLRDFFVNPSMKHDSFRSELLNLKDLGPLLTKSFD